MSKLNFAVIGVGRMGKRHAFNLYHGLLRGVRLAAVCDTDDAALSWCARNVPRAKRYIDYRQLFENEKLDGAIIAVPHYFHPEIALYSINKGINTLIEKPLAVSTAGAKAVIAAVRNNPGVKAGVSLNQRSNPMYQRAKKLLDSGRLGAVRRVSFTITDWYRSQAYYNQGGWRARWSGEGGGCLINQCVHQLDILQWLVGMPRAISAQCATVDRRIGVENDVAAIFDYGAYKCSFSASTHELKGTNRLEIACDKGKIIIGSFFMRVYLHRSEEEVNAQTEHGYGFAPSRLSIGCYGIFRLLADLIKGQQLRSLRAFASEIRGSGKMLASAEDGLASVELINGCYLSSWKQKAVQLPLDDREYSAALDSHRTLEGDARDRQDDLEEIR